MKELTESDALYLDLSSKSAAAVHSGVSTYNIEQPTADTDSVGQPITHRWAKQCATGEAVFTDDILPSEGLSLSYSIFSRVSSEINLIEVKFGGNICATTI